MKTSISRTKKVVLAALFVSAGIVLQTAEQALPLFQSIPGGKLGLANVTSIAGILLLGALGGTALSIIRALLGCFIFGGVAAIPYSVCGAAFSSVLMCLLICSKQKVVSFIGIGVVGACAHNIAQVMVASIILNNTYIWTYMPVLMIIGVFSGGIVGTCSKQLSSYLYAHKMLNGHIDRKA